MTNKNRQYIVWLISLPLLILGSIYSLSLALTLTVEIILALCYVFFFKKEIENLITLVLVANIFTQTALWILLIKFPQDSYWWTIACAEIGIFFVEAIIFYYPLKKKKIKFREAMGLSLLLNAVSFGLGLFLPV